MKGTIYTILAFLSFLLAGYLLHYQYGSEITPLTMIPLFLLVEGGLMLGLAFRRAKLDALEEAVTRLQSKSFPVKPRRYLKIRGDGK
ncbi:hypothetical protein DRJ19_00620 [Candidatus Woesearchaeota archaeon]|nr:MAG: hypothetical protein DRJ19_00620 [Candidatus Woesearchaeota archaeon]